jgi:hypothetical protein
VRHAKAVHLIASRLVESESAAAPPRALASRRGETVSALHRSVTATTRLLAIARPGDIRPLPACLDHSDRMTVGERHHVATTVAAKAIEVRPARTRRGVGWCGGVLGDHRPRDPRSTRRLRPRRRYTSRGEQPFKLSCVEGQASSLSGQVIVEVGTTRLFSSTRRRVGLRGSRYGEPASPGDTTPAQDIGRGSGPKTFRVSRQVVRGPPSPGSVCRGNSVQWCRRCGNQRTTCGDRRAASARLVLRAPGRGGRVPQERDLLINVGRACFTSRQCSGLPVSEATVPA